MTASLSPKQQRSIVGATSRINLWDGSVRSGKTVASTIALLHDIAARPNIPTLITGKTKDTIARNVIDPIADLLGSEFESSVQYTSGANQGVIFGQRVYVVGANDAKAESRIRGMTLGRAYVDEASLVPEAFFRQLLARLSLKGSRLYATTNPDSPRHWLKKQFIDRIDELNMRRWHFVLDDNPGLDPTYVADLKTEYTGLWYRRFIQGLWVVAAGAIYDSWDPQTMTVTSVPALHRTWLAIDYGTTNPFHAVLLGLADDGTVYATHEWRYDSKTARRQLTDGEYADKLRAWLASISAVPEWTYVDPSAASFKTQLYTDGWYGVREADNAVLDGIRTVASALNAGRLKIHARCEYLIGEIEGYVWDERAQERGEDSPAKVDDHGVDALRYGMSTSRHIWQYANAT